MTADGKKDELATAFDWVHHHLLCEIAKRGGKSRRGRKRPPTPLALADLSDCFDLSPFEADLLLLLAGAEVDRRIAAALAELTEGDQPGAQRAGALGFGHALALLPDGHWSAAAATRPLRRWRLVDWRAGPAILSAGLSIDERVLFFLMGVDALDPRLSQLVSDLEPREPPTPSQLSVIDQMAIAAGVAQSQGATPVLQLCGGDQRTMAEVAATFFLNHDLAPLRLPLQNLPHEPERIAELATLWERETALSAAALVLDAHGAEGDPPTLAAAALFLDQISAAVVVLSPERLTWPGAVHSFDILRPTVEEQTDLWAPALGGDKAAARRLAHFFSMEARDIRAISLMVGAGDGDGGEAEIWDACRGMAAPGVIAGITISQPKTRLDALRLPPGQLDALRQIVARQRNRATVYGDWGCDADGLRGMGVSALFSGASGTGKTFAAEILAAELSCDLHRVDVSSVVNKYIGETEKALRKIFDVAEHCGAVLLFDEADALFGKRGEVKDSHDRYANIGVSYLLQRFEAYRGLSILTTNLKDNIDSAFLRRFTCVIDFPFPDIATRAALWRDAFTAETPTKDLNFDALAGLTASGAEIRNIAIGAAFLAADDGGPVTMARIKRAAALEMEKAGRKLTQADARGWT